MAVLCLTFDSSTGQLKAQKVGSDQIGNGAVLSAHIGAGIIGGAHFNPNDQWAGRVFSGRVTIYGGGENPLTLLDADPVVAIMRGLDEAATRFETSSATLLGYVGIQSGGIAFIAAQAGKKTQIMTHALGTGPYGSLSLGDVEAARFNGVAISGHTHTGGANDAPQIASGGIAASIIGAAHLFTPPLTSGYVIIGQGSGVTPVYGSPPAGTPGDNTITSAKIASGQVGDGHIYPASIVSGKIGANIIATPHILNQGILSASIGANVIGPPLFERFASGQIIKGQGTGANAIYKDEMAAIAFVIDGFGSSIQTGTKGWIEMPFPGTLNRVTMLGDQSGQITVDIYKDSYSNFPPTATDSICSSVLPTISGSFKYQDSTLTGWVKTIASGDILAYVVSPNASNIQVCTVSLGMYR